MACSFCGKTQKEVKKLIAGPKVYICDECVGLCNDIIAEEIYDGKSQIERLMLQLDDELQAVERIRQELVEVMSGKGEPPKAP